MNTRLIFQLSLFGLAMAFATVFFISSKAEPYVWFLIFVFCAVTIAKKCKGKFFMHGFFVSVVNSVWITTVHVILFEQYIANHPDIMDAMTKAPMPYSPRIMILMMGLPIGGAFGIVLGIFCFVAARVIGKKTTQKS